MKLCYLGPTKLSPTSGQNKVGEHPEESLLSRGTRVMKFPPHLVLCYYPLEGIGRGSCIGKLSTSLFNLYVDVCSSPSNLSFNCFWVLLFAAGFFIFSLWYVILLLYVLFIMLMFICFLLIMYSFLDVLLLVLYIIVSHLGGKKNFGTESQDINSKYKEISKPMHISASFPVISVQSYFTVHFLMWENWSLMPLKTQYLTSLHYKLWLVLYHHCPSYETVIW